MLRLSGLTGECKKLNKFQIVNSYPLSGFSFRKSSKRIRKSLTRRREGIQGKLSLWCWLGEVAANSVETLARTICLLSLRIKSFNLQWKSQNPKQTNNNKIDSLGVLVETYCSLERRREKNKKSYPNGRGRTISQHYIWKRTGTFMKATTPRLRFRAPF